MIIPIEACYIYHKDETDKYKTKKIAKIDHKNWAGRGRMREVGREIWLILQI